MATAVETSVAAPVVDSAIVERGIKRSFDLFASLHTLPIPDDPISQRVKLSSKILDEYANLKELPPAVVKQQQTATTSQNNAAESLVPSPATDISESAVSAIIDDIPAQKTLQNGGAGAVAIRSNIEGSFNKYYPGSDSLVRIKEPRKVPKPTWHAPWKLMRVIPGHIGWVKSVCVDPGNQWFVTGGGDRLIKIWDLASGILKLTLTGHISTVRGLQVSARHPYLFSCGEDKLVKCWDLEYNKAIRSYHGHLSGVYTLALHPTLDVLVTGGRDSCARVWDMRTKTQIYALTGHTATISTLKCQASDPQIITGSNDSTIKLWDLAAGKTMTTLTHHKKSVRAISLHPTEFSFASASPDNIKQWKFPEGKFIQNLEGQNTIINTMAQNAENVLFSGGDNGSMHFWDWKSGYNFQRAETKIQPGSLDSECGIFCSTFDMSGSRLITGEADKTVKMWKEDENATPETHPIDWQPSLIKSRY
ncbi:Pleiotropic regulator 1 [Nowakowskiella sp. JEL0078]|nr:Pleiotropic regulator 1 [Nowakowskiella sp. JEL0078]